MITKFEKLERYVGSRAVERTAYMIVVGSIVVGYALTLISLV
jgi:hypothetical protein